MSKVFLNEKLVEQLSSVELLGRVPTTEGHKKAREIIVREFEKRNLDYVIPNTWEQEFQVKKNKLVKQEFIGRNLLAIKKAKIPTNEWVLLGAHYDHVDTSFGANDNAASIGAIFETLDYLENHDYKHNIVLAIFDTEEPPYFNTENMGSFHFYNKCPLNLDKLKCAIILDLIGHDVMIEGKENTLFAIGTDTQVGFYDKVKQARENTEGLDVYSLQRGVHLSDHIVFDKGNKPHLFLSSGVPHHYHTFEDTFDNLNLDKIARVGDFMKNFLISLEKTSTNYMFTEKDEFNEICNFLEVSDSFVLKSVLSQLPNDVLKMGLTQILSSDEKQNISEIKTNIVGLITSMFTGSIK